MVAEERRETGLPVEVWATDEHRLGLKPGPTPGLGAEGRAPGGARPSRFEWFYVTAFVAPSSGETVWYLSDGIDKRLFEMMLARPTRRNSSLPSTSGPSSTSPSPTAISRRCETSMPFSPSLPVPPPRPRPDRGQYLLQLVANDREPEVISRIWHQGC